MNHRIKCNHVRQVLRTTPGAWKVLTKCQVSLLTLVSCYLFCKDRLLVEYLVNGRNPIKHTAFYQRESIQPWLHTSGKWRLMVESPRQGRNAQACGASALSTWDIYVPPTGRAALTWAEELGGEISSGLQRLLPWTTWEPFHLPEPQFCQQ